MARLKRDHWIYLVHDFFHFLLALVLFARVDHTLRQQSFLDIRIILELCYKQFAGLADEVSADPV